MILVVGATGQLGSAVTRKLVAAGKPARAFVRKISNNFEHLKKLGVELAYGDLRDAASVQAACHGVEVILATAGSAIPAKGDNTDGVDGQGYAYLIEAAKQAGVKQFVFASAGETAQDEYVKYLKYKRINEKRLQASGLNYTILRYSVFMDVWLALLGSRIPERGAEMPTIRRPFWFSQMFMGLVGGLIENRGIAVVPGKGTTRAAFITVNDAASVMANCVGHPAANNAILHIGGPEVLSWNEALAIFGQVLGRKVTPIHTPAGIFRVNHILLSPIAEGPANIMGMNWMTGSSSSPFDSSDTRKFVAESLITVREFLEQKVKLPASA